MDIDSNFIAYWGAGLSTLLALIKLWELWLSRRRIDVGYSFNGNPEEGNDIIIRNISDKSLIVTYWQLQFCKREWLQGTWNWAPYRAEDAEAYNHDICITEHSSEVLNFSGMDYFDWGHKAMKGKRIYLKLHIAGKKSSVRHFVYGQ